MKMELTPEEWMRMQSALVEARVENALLHDELVRARAERDQCRAQMLAAHLEELMQQRDLGKVVPLVLSKMPLALKGLDNMDQVRLVVFTILRMLPDNAPADVVKMLTDTLPDEVKGHELVRMEVGKAGDIIGQGGTKNVISHGQEPEKGDKTI